MFLAVGTIRKATAATLIALAFATTATVRAQPPLRPIELEDIDPEGLLRARAELAFDHLHSDYFRWDSISKVNFEPFPGDAIGRCINALTLLSRALHREESPSLRVPGTGQGR